MKKAFLSIILICSIQIPCTSDNFKQDSSQWYLPEGAIARLGKGRVNEIAYSPNGKHLAVASRSEERRVGKECRSRWSPYH